MTAPPDWIAQEVAAVVEKYYALSGHELPVVLDAFGRRCVERAREEALREVQPRKFKMQVTERTQVASGDVTLGTSNE